MAMWEVPFGFTLPADVKFTRDGSCQDESSNSGLFQESPETDELQNKRLSAWDSAKLVTNPVIGEPNNLVHENVITNVSIPELGSG